MNSSVNSLKARPWDLWFRQILAVTKFEARKSFAGRRWVGALLLAGGPVFLLTVRVLLGDTETEDVGTLGIIFATIFQSYILRLAIFFGCVAVFTQLFRGEVLEKTLHYYLLAPVRREIIMTGKYLGGLLNVSVLFVLSTVASYVLMFVPSGSRVMEAQFVNGPGVGYALTYAQAELRVRRASEIPRSIAMSTNTPLSFRYNRSGTPLNPTNRSASPSPSMSAHALLSVPEAPNNSG